MAASSVWYFVGTEPAASFERLGFPDYFRIQLGIAKMAGAIALVMPVPRAVKEWTMLISRSALYPLPSRTLQWGIPSPTWRRL